MYGLDAKLASDQEHKRKKDGTVDEDLVSKQEKKAKATRDGKEPIDGILKEGKRFLGNLMQRL